MTHIEQAIADALAQGYEPPMELIPEAASFTPLQISVAMKSDVFLDPVFWQALGRARGWTTDEDGKYWRGTLAEWKANYWKTHWHNFIDQLAAGEDAESFFARVSAKKAVS
ncbi:MAG: hypothetical protein ACXWKA_12060 [Xanthobacteraceae bacterium]